MKEEFFDNAKRLDKLTVAELEKIIDSIISSAEHARQEINDISDEAREEFSRLANELLELKQETNAIIYEVETCEQEEKLARVRLMEVSRDFDAYSESDIKEAYDTAWNLQVRLSVLREKEKNFIRRRNDLERSIKRIGVIVSRAEVLFDQVNKVVKILKGHAEVVTSKLEEAYRKQQLGMWIVQAQEEERRKMARDLHDGPAQGLSNLVMRMDLIERLWDKDQERVRKEIAELKNMVRDNIGEIRRIIFDLRPMALDDLGLVPALKRYLCDYGEKYGLLLEFLFFGDEKRLALPMEVAIFRLIQEAVTNVRRHAQVNRALVKLEMGETYVTVVVKDEGLGFDPKMLKDRQGSYGILGMKERVELFGGRFTVRSRENYGTRVIIHLPLEQGEGR